MQTAQAIIESHQKLVISNASSQTGGIGGFLARMFGCRHKEMSRPFSIQGQTYRTCLDCGARRQFNLKRWEMHGDYYYGQPGDKVFRPFRGLVTQQARLTASATVLNQMSG